MYYLLLIAYCLLHLIACYLLPLAYRHRRRKAWGRPQRAPVKSLDSKEKAYMTEAPKNQDLIGGSLTFLLFTKHLK